MRVVQQNKNIIPGIYRIGLLPVTDIKTYVNDPSSGFARITLHQDKNPSLLNAAIDSSNVTISTVSNDSGVYYRCNIRCFIQGISEANQHLMMDFAKNKFIAILKGYDTVQRSIGTFDIPLDFTFRETYTPRLGYEVTLSGDVPITLVRTVLQYEINAPITLPDNPDYETYDIGIDVVSASSLSAIDGATVAISFNGGLVASLQTGAAGKVLFSNFSDGVYGLSVSKTGFEDHDGLLFVNGQDLYSTVSLMAEY
jgi:hypothetical protein